MLFMTQKLSRKITLPISVAVALVGGACDSISADNPEDNRLQQNQNAGGNGQNGQNGQNGADENPDVGFMYEGPEIHAADDYNDDGTAQGNVIGHGPPYPIVFVHGFSGFVDLGIMDYFYRVEQDLRQAGEEVFFPLLPAYNAPEQRGRVLASYLDDVLAQTGSAKVHIIAHSQGGVDSRYVISSLGYADRVASLTTISTPHRGTAVADLAKIAPDGLLNPAGQLLAWAIGSLDGPPDESAWDDESLSDAWTPEIADAIESLSTDGMDAFNERNPDAAGVPMFSVAGVSNLAFITGSICRDSVWGLPSGIDPVDPIFLASGIYLSGLNPFDLTLNDGLITVESARWGTFLGCVPADHLDEVGLFFDSGAGLLDGFDHLKLMRDLVKNARSVE